MVRAFPARPCRSKSLPSGLVKETSWPRRAVLTQVMPGESPPWS